MPLRRKDAIAILNFHRRARRGAIRPAWILIVAALVFCAVASAAVSVSPSAVTLSAGESQQFNAKAGSDKSGVNWSLNPQVGGITPDGIYTAPAGIWTTQTVTVIATSIANSSASDTATVSLVPTPAPPPPPPPVTVTISPGTVTLSVLQSVQFSATVAGANNTSVTWSISPSIGTLSGKGAYTAPSSISSTQSVTIKATSKADSTKYATATVTLTPPAVTVSVSILPLSASLQPSQSQQFTASVVGTSNTGIIWSVNGAGGISTSGLYTAPSSINSKQTVTVTATSSADTTKSASASVTLNPPITVTMTPTTASIKSGQTQQYAATVTGTTNTAVGWNLNPAVGSISSGGLYTAPASVTATQTVTVIATSMADTTKTASASVIVLPAALAISTTGLPGGTVGTAYNATIVATGGTMPYSWSVSSGQLPTGLGLGTATGAISGTPSTNGSYTVTVQVADSSGQKVLAIFTIAVAAGTCTSCPTALTITTTSLPNGVVGSAYSATLAASGGTTPYIWSIVSGQMPPGVALASTGALSGTPATVGSYSPTFQVADAAGTKVTSPFTISITSTPSGSGLNISNADLPNGTIGQTYSATLSASGGTAPYTWSLANGFLPAGLTLNGATGAISGTPTSAGWSNLFSLSVQDAAGARASLTYSVIIKSALDQYGGYLGQTCTATGKFHTQKIGSRWWFCDPLGYIYWNLSVGAIGGQADSGSDSNTGVSFNLAATNTAKYGDTTYNWAIAQNRRLQLWGFNGVGQFSSGFVKPMATGFSTGDGTQPVKMPMTDTLVVSNYAGVNLWGYGPRPLKNLAQGYSDKSRVWVGHGKAIMDYLDSTFQTYVSTFLANDTAVQAYKASSYVLGLFLDDTDWSWGFGAGPDFPTQPSLGHNNSAPAYQVMVTSPVQRFQRNPAYANFGVMYSEGRVFSKTGTGSTPAACGIMTPCSLRDYLYNKYNGSIAALNGAWGSNYTTFDSTGAPYTGVQVGVGNGSATAFSFTLPNTPVSPYSVAVYVNGIQVGGDCPYYNAGCNSIGNVGSFMSPQGTWSPGQVYGQTYIVDPNGNLQQAQNNGNNGGVQPAWNKTYGGATIAGDVTWKNLGPTIKSGSSAPWAADSQLSGADCGSCGLPQASYWFQTTWHAALSAPSRLIGGTFSSGAPQITITTQNNANDAPAGTTSVDIYVSCRVLNGPASHGCVASGDPQPAPTLQASGVAYPTGSWTEPVGGLVAGAALPPPPSSIVYTSGIGSIGFNTPPAAGAVITVDYIANGWPYGTGLLDEDGRHATWLGTNDVCLTPHNLVCGAGLSFPAPNANPVTGADLEAWNAQFAASYFSQNKAAMNAQLPGVLYFGTDTLGTWGAPPPLGVLQGAAPYIDAMFTTVYPGQTYSDSIYQFITQYLGDKPMMNFLTEQATPDSLLSPYGAQPAQIIAAAAQAQRGQNWYSTINALLNAQSYNGTYQWIGANWWGLYDFWGEKTNWGLVSLYDNPYDGKSSCQQQRADPWGYSTGGELPASGAACFGNALDYVKQANSLPYTMVGK